MPKPTYTRQPAPKSHCPNCACGMTLLIKKVLTVHGPIFFICWNCERIYQAGKGLVTNSSEDVKLGEL